MAAKTETKKIEKKQEAKAPVTFSFGRKNYILMLAGIGLLALGFILMYGPAGEDIFEFRRITLAPLIVLAGFVVEVFAIFAKPQSK